MIALDTTTYTSLITSEHSDQPNFVAWVTLFAQWAVDRQAVLQRMQLAFGLEQAAGVQLDATGIWAGQDRTPLGYVLDDVTYRYLLRATVAANVWDGTVGGAYVAYDQLSALYDSAVVVQNNRDMSITQGLVGPVPNPVMGEFLTSETLGLVPAAVRVKQTHLATVSQAPLFCLGVEATSYVGGFGIGCWGTIVKGS